MSRPRNKFIQFGLRWYSGRHPSAHLTDIIIYPAPVKATALCGRGAI